MFHTLFYEPVYNLLVIVLTVVPLHDIGAAIVIVTLHVKLVLLPLNLSALRTQYMMKKVEGEMGAIKELQKKDPQGASQQMIADELNKLFDLLQKGAITHEEYIAQKNKLMGT